MLTIVPEPNRVLVELPTSEFGSIPVPPKSHDSLTYGVVLAVHETDVEHKGYLVGRVAYWRKYKDDARVGKNWALIDISDLMGSAIDDTSSKDNK